jgi:hypothetical protein
MIDMSFSVKKILSEHSDVVATNIQVCKDLFVVDKGSTTLKLEEAWKFHTTVACLLYLSRCGRPDIITLVGFLCIPIELYIPVCVAKPPA